MRQPVWTQDDVAMGPPPGPLRRLPASTSRRSTTRRAALAVLAVGGSLLGHWPASAAASDQAATYPNRAIRIIVPFPPGGGSDLVARTVAHQLGERWKVSVVVDNKPGGNTLIAAETAARSAPDGYTLFVPIDSTLSLNQSLYAKLPYDPIRSFTPITLAVTMPMVLAAHPDAGLADTAAVIRRAKAQAGSLTYAHGALPAQVAGEALKAAAGVDLTAVPYKGSAPAMTDAVAGVVPLIFDALGPAMPYIRSGKVRPLAVTSAERSPSLPDVPTVAESASLPGFDIVTWIGFVAPAGTDPAIIAKLNREIVDILRLPDSRQRLGDLGMRVEASSADGFASRITGDADRLGAIVKAAGIRLD